MIGSTKLTPANAACTLRTTVPIALVRLLNLKEGCLLEWDMEVRDGKMLVLVRPVPSSNTEEDDDK